MMKKKQYMWVLRNKKTKKIIYTGVYLRGGHSYIAGMETKKGLMLLLGGHVLKPVQGNEEVVRLEIKQ